MNTPFAYLALTAAITTGSWLPILIAITTTTILATSISKTLIDGYVISKNQIAMQSDDKISIDTDKILNKVDNTMLVVSSNLNDKTSNLIKVDKINTYLSGSTNILYGTIIIGLSLTGIGIALFGLLYQH